MSLPKPGFFITFEGLEGAGKTTQVARLCAFLKTQDIDVVQTHEPGGTEFAEKIRHRLLHSGKSYSPLIEAILFSVARKSHIIQRIAPALKQGQWVVCDRFVDTTRAYQGGGRGVPDILLKTLLRLTIGHTYPDLTVLLDIAPQEIAKRLEKRGSTNAFDTQRQDFFERAQATYAEITRAEPQRMHHIDALLAEDVIADKISAIVVNKITQWKET